MSERPEQKRKYWIDLVITLGFCVAIMIMLGSLFGPIKYCQDTTIKKCPKFDR